MMQFKIAKSLLQRSKEKLYWSGAFILGLLITNGILGVSLYRMQTNAHMVIIPTTLTKPIQVTSQSVDANYLEQMGLLFVYARLNITPKTIARDQQLLLTYTDPTFYAGFKHVLDQEQKTILKQQISSVFYPTALKLNPERLILDVAGTLKRWVGPLALKTSQKHYRIQFKYRLGRLWIQNFITVEGHNA